MRMIMRTVSDLQKSIFYAIENYDNWRDIPVFYQKDISKNKTESIVFEANIDDMDYHSDSLNFNSYHGDENDTICLESLSYIINEMVDNEVDWFNKLLKFHPEVDIEFETPENIMIKTKDFDYIEDFFINDECFILIG